MLTGVAPTDNKSTTVRVNYDQTLTPTLLLHLAAGYLYTYNPGLPSRFDQGTIGLSGFYSNTFPSFTGLNSAYIDGSPVYHSPETARPTWTGAACRCSARTPT